MSLNTTFFFPMAALGCFVLSVYQMLPLIPYVDRCSCFLDLLVGTVCSLYSPGWHEEVNLRLCVLEHLLGLGQFHLEQQVAVWGRFCQDPFPAISVGLSPPHLSQHLLAWWPFQWLQTVLHSLCQL